MVKVDGFGGSGYDVDFEYNGWRILLRRLLLLLSERGPAR
jgi:hypothetical protein